MARSCKKTNVQQIKLSLESETLYTKRGHALSNAAQKGLVTCAFKQKLDDGWPESVEEHVTLL